MENLEIKVGYEVYIKLNINILYLRDRPKYKVESIKSVTKYHSNYGSSSETYDEYIATLTGGIETNVSNLIPVTEEDAQDNSIKIDDEPIKSYKLNDVEVKKLELNPYTQVSAGYPGAVPFVNSSTGYMATGYTLTFVNNTKIENWEPEQYNGLFDIVVTQNDKELFRIKGNEGKNKKFRPKQAGLFDGGRRKSKMRKQRKSKKQRKSRKFKRRKSRKY
jgi:hypothetical protein